MRSVRIVNESLGQIYESDQQDQHESYNLILKFNKVNWLNDPLAVLEPTTGGFIIHNNLFVNN